MKTVSTRGFRRRFISAIWNSYSKSETARRPRTIVRAPTRSMKSTSRPEKLSTRQKPSPPTSSRIISTRSSTEKSGAFSSLSQHRHDHLVEHRPAARDDVEVAVVERVERAGVDRDPPRHRFRQLRGRGRRSSTLKAASTSRSRTSFARRRELATTSSSRRPSSSPSAAGERLPARAVDRELRLAQRAPGVVHPDARAPPVATRPPRARAASGRSPPARSPRRASSASPLGVAARVARGQPEAVEPVGQHGGVEAVVARPRSSVTIGSQPPASFLGAHRERVAKLVAVGIGDLPAQRAPAPSSRAASGARRARRPGSSVVKMPSRFGLAGS